ncbi:MAG: RES family NAD+ phosphorylase [Gemmatimonadales bacterium]
MSEPSSAPLPAEAFADLPRDVPGGVRGLVRMVAAALTAVAFFESLAPGADVDALLSVLALTSPALLDQVGAPTGVPVSDRSYGAGSGWVMPSFTRHARPSRFSDGRFGVLYAASDAATATAETLYHQAIRLRETAEPAQTVAVQLLSADVAGFAAVLSGLGPPLGALVHHPTSYLASQLVGKHLRDRGSDAIVYRSVRHEGGACIGVLRPRVVRHCQRTGLVSYQWDGETLTAFRA